MIAAAKTLPKPSKNDNGVACPGCGCGHAPVWYTRQRTQRTVRVRICRNCARRFSTVERVV